MAVLLRTLLLAWCAMAVCGQKAQVTRTALHVARSLNPEATETMTVRTRTGDVATLIVKRRSGRQQPDFTPTGLNASSNASRAEQKTIPVPHPVDVTSSFVETKDEKDIKNVIVDNSAPKRESKTDVLLPEPVFVKSSPVLVKGQQNDLWKKRSRSLTEVGPDGIPVVTGVRMPDDDSDKQVWRNARVINGMLRPYDKTQPKHTFDINSSQVNEKKKPFLQSGLGWQHIQLTTQKPPNEGLVSQKDEWQKTEPVKQGVAADFRPSEVLAVIDSPTVQEWHQYPQEVVAVIDEPTVKIPQEDQYIRDRILEYIKRINQQELVNRQQARNSRMIAEAADRPKMEARVLHTPGANVYPTSLLYSPPSSQPSRVSFEEGVRTPVLQYAHPELGVQPANVVTTPETEHQSETEKTGDRRDQALAYFAHDIHSDRSPYAFEPGLEEEAKVEDYGGNAKRSHSGGILQRPKKNLAYFYPEQSVPSGYNSKHYGKYGYNDYSGGYGGYYQAYQVSDGRPFWERLSDTIKGHVQTGIEKMTVITRPVVEPLMEASHKISENLGFASGNRELSSVKEKMGIVGTPSILLPALGLVAGGAALGLGAVAVGRYLDVDLLKRSKDSSDFTLDDLPAEHKRAIEAISKDLANNQSTKVPAKTREKRSVEPEDVLEDILQSLESAGDVGESSSVLSAQGVWNNTPCAKRVFCEVMVQQPHDAIVLMEKKMATYLQMIHPSMTDTVGFHLDDVMSAVRSHDCSPFRCPVTNTRHRQQRPSPR